MLERSDPLVIDAFPASRLFALLTSASVEAVSKERTGVR
jgi:hypothetical protein